MKATLVLSDGTRFQGTAFGYQKPTVGEVVFNTAMMGYPESLTDPSYAGQILVMTYPLVGNYGVPSHEKQENQMPCFFESDHIYVQALIVADYSEEYSHWNAVESLDAWMKREHIPGITGVDTRAITKIIREQGVMMGQIVIGDEQPVTLHDDYEQVNYVAEVSCKEVVRYNEGAGRKRVVLIDCGCKNNIIRSLIKAGLEVIRVPWNYDFTDMEYDGLFVSNGPGNPAQCEMTVAHIRKVMELGNKPVMGICLGNQLMGMAIGAVIYKLKYGHRGHNQPVRKVGSNQCFIVSQNHGYAIDETTLPEGWTSSYINMNDGSNEGLKNDCHPWFSVQFHPEACSGPLDTESLFDYFVKMLND